MLKDSTVKSPLIRVSNLAILLANTVLRCSRRFTSNSWAVVAMFEIQLAEQANANQEEHTSNATANLHMDLLFWYSFALCWQLAR